MTGEPASTRRGFLRNSAALAGAAQLGGSGLRAAPSDKVNLGFIGVGVQGTNLLRWFQAIPDVNVAACADLYDGHLVRAKELTGGKTDTGKEYRTILDRKDIDAVVIATPDHWHKRIVLDAVSAGKDVYCEKPLTWSVEEGLEIQRAMKNNSRLLEVGSAGKTSATTAKAKEIVQSGVLGKINMVCASNNRNSEEGAWRYPIPPDASPQTVDWPQFLGSAPKIPWNPEHFFRWRCWWEYSGGVATDLFVHLLTTLHEILGVTLPKSVVSSGGIYRWRDGRTVPDLMDSLFEYPEGFVIELCVNLGNARGQGFRGLTIMGSEATLVIGERQGELNIYPESSYRLQRYATECWPEKMRERYFESMGFSPDGKPRTPPPAPKKPEQVRVAPDPDRPSHLGFFIRSVKQRSPSVEDAAAGHNAAAAAHMANKAYRERRMIGIEAATGKLLYL